MQTSQRKQPPPPPLLLLAAPNQTATKARKIVLEEKGYQVVSVHKKKDALQRLEEQQIALLIVDFSVDHSSGLELINQAAEVAPDLPSILLVDMLQEVSADLTDCRAAMVVPKQAEELSNLIRSVEKLLRRRSPRKRPSAIRKPMQSRKLG